MSIHKKPERIVDLLIRRLSKTKSLIGGLATTETRDYMISKLEDLEREIQSTHAFSTRIRSFEDSIVGKLVQLDKSIDCDLKELETLDQSKFDNKFNVFIENISQIKELISLIPPPSHDDAAVGDVSRENKKQQQQEQHRSGQGRTPSEQWADLIMRRQGILVTPLAMEIFQASFRSIRNSKLKLCLLCFSIFPEKCEIKKKPMIYWWMAEGLVTSDIDGDNTYRDLIKTGLIIPVNGKTSCTLQPWIRHMLIHIAKESEFGRSLLLVENSKENQTNNGFKEEDLSTVFNVNKRSLTYNDEWFSKLKKVVVLQLGRWQASPKHHVEMENDESLNGLKTQKRLKYLSLRGISRITQLPRSITELVSLTILDLRACHNLESLPSDISALKNLTHLDVSECYLLESMPKGIDKLLALSVLKGFIIGNQRNPTCQVSDLTGLTKLTKLSIYIRAKATVDKKEFEKLKDIESLRVLTISWGKDAKLEQESKLTSIAFPEKLQKLDLRCIPEETTLEWLRPLKFPDLEKLYIKGGSLTDFAISDNVINWKLKTLRLRYLESLTTTKQDLKEMLPPGVHIDI